MKFLSDQMQKQNSKHLSNLIQMESGAEQMKGKLGGRWRKRERRNRGLEQSSQEGKRVQEGGIEKWQGKGALGLGESSTCFIRNFDRLC